MLDQTSNYLSLLDSIATTEPSEGSAKALVRLAEEPINQDDVLELLLLAEEAAHARQWQAAAQLFSRMMVSSFSRRYAEAYLVEHAKRITLLTTEHQAKLQSATDLLLYGHRRLIASLRRDGIREPHIGEWMVTAFSQLLRGSHARIAAIQAAVAELHPDNNRITRHYQSEIGPARKLLACSLRLQGNDAAWVWVSNEGRRSNLVFLGVAVVVIAGLAYAFWHWFPFPASRLVDRYGFGSWVRAALIAWPLLLVATWLFAFFESIRTHTYYFISPVHLLARRIVAGEIMPFSRDSFFHIFQFVWVLLVIIAWLLFKKYEELLGWLPSVWSLAAQDMLPTFTHSLTVAVVASDALALVLAVGLCAYSIGRQRSILNERVRTGKDIYWWDRRINPTEWRIRLTMVGVDMFLVSFLLVKILMMLFIAYELVTTNTLMISYFSPDGVGGLKPFTDMLMYLSWVVFLFGVFVFASLYLHWNLREYRRNDLRLVVIYFVFVALTLVPLGVLESKLSVEGDARLVELVKSGTKPEAKLEDTGKYVRDVNSVRDWRVSAVNVGVLGNPVLPLGFQFMVIVFQSLGRAGKLPKLPIPGLGEESASKGAHGSH